MDWNSSYEAQETNQISNNRTGTTSRRPWGDVVVVVVVPVAAQVNKMVL